MSGSRFGDMFRPGIPYFGRPKQEVFICKVENSLSSDETESYPPVQNHVLEVEVNSCIKVEMKEEVKMEENEKDVSATFEAVLNHMNYPVNSLDSKVCNYTERQDIEKMDDSMHYPFTSSSYPLAEHDYCIRIVSDDDLNRIKELEQSSKKDSGSEEPNENRFAKKFSKCDKCRRSRTKVLLPNSLLSITNGKNDGFTCDFCGDVMEKKEMVSGQDGLEGRRGSRNVPYMQDSFTMEPKKKNYVYCSECGKVVLKESLLKHTRDVHEKSNKRNCPYCEKSLSGPFSLREHISAVHEKVAKHKCEQCGKKFSHFSNMNRHRRLVHDKTVITHK